MANDSDIGQAKTGQFMGGPSLPLRPVPPSVNAWQWSSIRSSLDDVAMIAASVSVSILVFVPKVPRQLRRNLCEISRNYVARCLDATMAAAAIVTQVRRLTQHSSSRGSLFIKPHSS
ncbi:hypothetical protein ACLKA7_003291 [Drosophila subpalustris]